MRAAQYVRMSTEHQQYSIANQVAAISDYAQLHGFDIVQTYTDSGKSGIDLKHRAGLRKLLDDVLTGSANFSAVLVYDVSRWGRFQDSDESAHYEFLCKQSGIRVHYCAEPFNNDDSLFSSLCKALKRSMAGEFSRELGVKVFAGQRRLTELGYKMGGPPGYALRRMLLSSDGTPERELGVGERKYLSTQRVVFSPGQEREVDTVRRIFRMYLDENVPLGDIARRLNAEGVLRPGGNPWMARNIYAILRDPKYGGCAVFGRSTKKLRSRSKAIPREDWIVRPESFSPIVPLEVVRKAQNKLSSRYFSDAEILDSIKAYAQEHGSIAKSLMRPANNLPDEQTVIAHFGSVMHAYELAGIGISTACANGHKAALSTSIGESALQQFEEAVLASQRPFRRLGRLYFLEGVQPFRFTTAKPVTGRGGRSLWRMSGPKGMQKHHCVSARLLPDFAGVQDWCLLEYVAGRSRGRRSFTAQELENSLRNTPSALLRVLLDRLATR